MLRTVRYRLWVESLEDRTLPATMLPGGSASDPTPPDGSDPDAAEYRSGGASGDAGTDTPSPSNGSGTATSPEYASSTDRPTTRPAPYDGKASEAVEYRTIPYAAPAPAAPAPAPPPEGAPLPAATDVAPTVASPPAADAGIPHATTSGFSADAAPPAPPQAPTESAEPAVAPAPVGAAVEPTAPEPSTEFSLPDVAASLAGVVEGLAVRVNLPADWDGAAARVLDTLAAAADDLLDPETGWQRIGYWAAAVAAVGVAVELSRQAGRTRRPGGGAGLSLEVT